LDTYESWHKMKLILERYHIGDKATIGQLKDVDGKRLCYTLELPKYGHPCCIPAGVYPVRGASSPRMERHGKEGKDAWVWWVDRVAGRGDIQIHPANEPKELLGCIAPGLTVKGTMDYVMDSRLAFKKILDYVGGWETKWELEIIEI